MNVPLKRCRCAAAARSSGFRSVCGAEKQTQSVFLSISNDLAPLPRTHCRAERSNIYGPGEAVVLLYLISLQALSVPPPPLAHTKRFKRELWLSSLRRGARRFGRRCSSTAEVDFSCWCLSGGAGNMEAAGGNGGQAGAGGHGSSTNLPQR